MPSTALASPAPDPLPPAEIVPSPTGGDVSTTGDDASVAGVDDTSATTDQDASSSVTATQQQPTNVVVVVRINSPGNDGPITQTNITVANSGASNSATTSQDRGSDAASGAQSASTGQQGGATATATQDGAGNVIVVVRMKSSGDNGPVSQTNGAGASSNATNTSATTQGAPPVTPTVQSAPPQAPAKKRKHRDAKTPASQPVAQQVAPTAPAPSAAAPVRFTAQSASPAAHRKHRHVAAAPHRHPLRAAVSSIARTAAERLPSLRLPTPSLAATPAEQHDVSRSVLLALLAVAVGLGTVGAMRHLPARLRR